MSRIWIFLLTWPLMNWGFGQTEPAATVNGEVITVKELVDYSVQLGGYNILQKMVSDLLMLQEAKRRGIEITEDEIQRKIYDRRKEFPNEDAYQKWMEAAHMVEKDLRHNATAEILMDKLVQTMVEVTDEKLQAYYQENQRQFLTKRQLRFKEICVNEEAEINLIKGQLAQGASFEELARQKSILPNAQQGGESGWVDEGIRGGITERGFRSLKPGMISDPIHAPDGWHIVLLEETKEPTIMPFEEVKKDVETAYRYRTVQEKYGELIQQLRNSAQVEIHLWRTQ